MKEVLNELLKGYRELDNTYRPERLVKRLSEALIERAIQTELTERPGERAG
jgi:hypothetical protein